MKRFLLVCLLILPIGALAAVEALEFKSAEDEARYNTMIKELRCLVCQNQDLADSNAELAKDLRQKTYRMIDDGKTDDEIVDYMVARYGDFVLYRPPLNMTTFFLWVGPFLILLLGVYLLLKTIRARRNANPDRAALTADELARIEGLMQINKDENK